MNRYLVALFGILATVYLLDLTPAPKKVAQRTEVAPTLVEVRKTYTQDLEAFVTAISAYSELSSQPATATELQTAHRTARQAFKKVEWLLAHLDEGSTNRHINGAPLPKVEQHVADIRILEPNGFQRLEELVYEDSLDREAIALLAGKLTPATKLVLEVQSAQRLNHARVWAAARYGVLRIYTLGVTGFDTPASEDALTENAIALRAIQTGLSPYFDQLPDSLQSNLNQYFHAGLTRLKNSDFDTFDRVAFYRESIGPLYDDLLGAQLHLQIDTPEEAGGRPSNHNYASTDLFADDFLNDYVFAGQPKEDVNFEKKRQLGKTLFYDTGLSSSNTLSCASCHDPARAFTDGEVTSKGSQGLPVKRNSPVLVGAVFSERYFADLREPQLARQIRHVIQDHNEFDTDYLTIINTLSEDSTYSSLFAEAYSEVDRDYQLSPYSVGDALASYVRTLHANSSPVDEFLRGETDALAENVQRGYNLFMGKAACGTCHFAPTFAGLVPPYYHESESEVLGVTTTWPISEGEDAKIDPDLGRMVSGRPLDGVEFYAFSFKTPTIRNAGLTAPYMHNGSIVDLAGVVDFYNEGGGVAVGLELPFQTLPFDNLDLTAQEQADIVAFLEALTDQEDWQNW